MVLRIDPSTVTGRKKARTCAGWWLSALIGIDTVCGLIVACVSGPMESGGRVRKAGSRGLNDQRRADGFFGTGSFVVGELGYQYVVGLWRPCDRPAGRNVVDFCKGNI